MRRFIPVMLCLLAAVCLPAFAQSQPAQPSLPEVPAPAELVTPDGPSQTELTPSLSQTEVSPDSESYTMILGPHLSQQEISELWRSLPENVQTLYRSRPVTQPPYVIGQLSPEYLENALAYLNLIRQLAGLEPVTLSDHLCVQAQYGAVLLAANDDLTHTPEKPESMESPFFRVGANACASSNLSMRYGYPPDQLLKSALQGHMDEDSPSNRLDLGHRRWLLNPKLGQVGFGLAPSSSGKQYIAVPVTDESGRGETPDMVLWPAAGYFPSQMFSPGTPWSVILNDQVYQTPREEELQVTVTRLRDGKQFVPPVLDGQSQLNREGSYLLVSSKPYGSGCCVSFSLGQTALETGQYWGSYQVEITGLRTLTGANASLEYTVCFFDAERPSRPSSWAETEVALAVQRQLTPQDLQDFYQQPITRLEHCRLMMCLLREKTGLSNDELAAAYAIPDPPVFWDCADPEVRTAASIGIVQGAGSGCFLPGGLVTRQDAALMLQRTAGIFSISTFLSDSSAGQLPFEDAQRISSYALPAVEWVHTVHDSESDLPVMAGTGSQFAPLEPFTREQAILSALRLFRWEALLPAEPDSTEP